MPGYQSEIPNFHFPSNASFVTSHHPTSQQTKSISSMLSSAVTQPTLKFQFKTFEKLPVKIWDDSREASIHVARIK